MEKKILVSKPVDPARLKGVGMQAFGAAVEQVKIMNEALAPHRGALSSCWVCGSNDSVPVASVHGIDFVQCNRCTHVYQSHIIPYETLRDYFADDTDINVHVADGQFEYRINELTGPKVQAIFDRMTELEVDVATGRWLDCGCGSGDMLYVVKQAGWETVGFDIGKAGVEIADNAGLRAYCTDLDGFVEGPFKNLEDGKTFDVVTAFGYLDTLTEPTNALKKIKSLLRPGGFICMHQPHFDSVTHDLNKRFPETAIRYLNAGQRSSFTRQSIERFLGDAGFEIVLEWRFGLDMYNIIASMSLAQPGFVDSAAYKCMLEAFNANQHIIDEQGMNDTMMVLARLV